MSNYHQRKVFTVTKAESHFPFSSICLFSAATLAIWWPSDGVQVRSQIGFISFLSFFFYVHLLYCHLMCVQKPTGESPHI